MEIIAAALLGLVSGFISALSTGGGMVMIPGLLFMGLSPVEAIATSRLGAVSSAVSSSYKYYKGRAISWRYMPYFLLLSIIAGIAGPQILLNLDQRLVQKMIAILLLALLPLLNPAKRSGSQKPRILNQAKSYRSLFIILGAAI